MAAAKTVSFVPAVSFLGFPDDVAPVNYLAGAPAETTPEYLKLLKSKGLVADPATSALASTKDAAG
jgi:hypothetical protein